MLSTFASRGKHSQIPLILSLYIAIYGREVTCQSSPQPIRVEATNTTAIQYTPALSTESKWSLIMFGNNETEVSTQHINSMLSFQFVGQRISLLANPEHFTVASLLIELDGRKMPITQDALNKSAIDANGLFTVFTMPTTGLDLHTVRVQKPNNGNSDNSIWNLVAMEFIPSSPNENATQPGLQSPSFIPSSQPTASVSSSSATSSLPVSKGGKIAGAVVGSLIGFGLAFLLGLFICRRRRMRNKVLQADPLVIEKARPNASSSQPTSFMRRMHSRRFPRFVAPPSVWPSSRSSSDYNELPTAASANFRQQRMEVPPPYGNESVVLADQKRQPNPQAGFVVTNPASNPSDGSQEGSNMHRSATAPPPGAYLPQPLARIAESTASSVATEKWLRNRKEVAKGKARAPPNGNGEISQPKPRLSRAQSLRMLFTTNPSPSTYSNSTASSKKSKEPKTRPETQAPPQMQHITPTVTPPPLAATKVDRSPAVTPSPKRTGSPPYGRQRESRTIFFTTNPSPPSVPDPADAADVASVTTEIPRPNLDKGKSRAF